MNAGNPLHPDDISILVVDDQREALELLSGILGNAGYRVRTATGGELALRSAATDPPAMILLDVKMPGMDGYEVCRRLKASPRTSAVPVIFVTWQDQFQDKVVGYKAGCVDFILKPFSKEEILAQVEAHLNLLRSEKELENSNARLREEVAEREATIRMLDLLNSDTGLHGLIQSICAFLQEQTGCDAVGVRLRHGDDFPYFETRGFPPEFVQSENTLCVKDLAGQVARDEIGNPLLECMCGNVLSERFDPSKPFFTERGSFWSNSTSALLASSTEADRMAHIRNRCNGEGYESVALIALRQGGAAIGLLQLNDRRTRRFTPGNIARMERLSDHLVVAIKQRLAEEALAESERRYRTVADFTYDWEYWTAADGRMEYCSPSCERTTGYSQRDFMEDPTLLDRVVYPDDRPLWNRHCEIIEGSHDVDHIDIRIVTKRNEVVWLSHYCSPVFSKDGQPAGRRVSNRGITERKALETQLKQAVKEKEILLKEIQHRVKNNLTTVAVLLELEMDHLTDEHSRAVFLDAQQRVRTMSVIYEQLYQRGGVGDVDIRRYIDDLAVSMVRSYAPGGRVSISVCVDRAALDLRRAVPLGLILNELVTNALKYAYPSGQAGEIRVVLKMDGGHVSLCVSDDGPGLPADVKAGGGTGMGLKLVEGFARQIRGTVSFEAGPGATVRLTFPA